MAKTTLPSESSNVAAEAASAAVWSQWWIYRPAILLLDPVFWPSQTMTSAQQLNALTRALLLLIALLLALGRYKYAVHVLIWGLLTIILTGLLMQSARRDIAQGGQEYPLGRSFPEGAIEPE